MEDESLINDDIIEIIDSLKNSFQNKPTIGKNILYYSLNFKFTIIDQVSDLNELKYYIKNGFVAIFMDCDKNIRIKRMNRMKLQSLSMRLYGSTFDIFNEYDNYVLDDMRKYCKYKIEINNTNNIDDTDNDFYNNGEEENINNNDKEYENNISYINCIKDLVQSIKN